MVLQICANTIYSYTFRISIAQMPVRSLHEKGRGERAINLKKIWFHLAPDDNIK